ncbi:MULTISPECIES: hypothetical protein [unclassified Nitratiruptor]|uniref:hypothetical protein n=1 Tax=unclassified Nitratiruptor TaxID=2624044 RepID=UPI001915A2A9|nr:MULTISPECIES: hypothetical protein [unclassified Nitratiruptor]BCD60282.1 hypothetical protein NitYY0810_C1047 [Nitratiruptor sp. YY08-10]BCD64229.1 hypothetical protein NitYY0814_C1074 [Nitratiruptor sp. YY08-14]
MERKEYKKIVGIDPYFRKYFVFDNHKNEIRLYNDVRTSKNDIHTSYFLTKDTIISNIKVSRNVPQEDLEDILTTKAYDELELDPTAEYKISFLELPTDLHSKEREFQLFITEYATLHDTYDEYIEKLGYLDFIFPVPYLLKTLYTKEILVDYETHLFIYFQNSDAFLTIYKNGHFVYTKSLKFSFAYMAERLTELKGSEVTIEELIANLSTYGLRLSDYEELQYYMQIFSELFMHINDILIYAKKSFDIENIDKIFISSDIGLIQGIEEYAQTYLGQKAYDFDFDYGIHVADPSVTHIHLLTVLTTQDCLEEEEECVNFTIFERPPALWKRPSGKLIMAIAASLVLGFSYPIYNYSMAYKYQIEKLLLQKKYAKIHAKRVSLESQINHIKNEIKKVDQQIQAVTRHLHEKEQSLKRIFDKKVHYSMKAVTIADFAQNIKKHKLHLLELNNTNKEFNLLVTAADDKRITEFIKDITNNASSKYDITTKDINKTKGLYMSSLKVKSR